MRFLALPMISLLRNAAHDLMMIIGPRDTFRFRFNAAMLNAIKRSSSPLYQFYVPQTHFCSRFDAGPTFPLYFITPRGTRQHTAMLMILLLKVIICFNAADFGRHAAYHYTGHA